MRRIDLGLAAPVLLGPAALAFAKGGYFDVPRLVAGVVACVVVIVVAVRDPRPLPRDAFLAVGGLAALTAWTGLSITWAPIAGPASDDFQRLLLYLFAFVAAVAVLRPPAVRRLVEPVLLAGIVVAALYGLSERLLPGVFALQTLPSADDRLAWPLTYWNAMGALTGMGLVLAAWIPSRAALATAPILGLACYLTFSRGALGATAAGLAVLLALSPTPLQLRRIAIAGGAAILAALASLPLSAVEHPGGSATQGAAMIAVLAILAAAAARLAPEGPSRDHQQPASGAPPDTPTQTAPAAPGAPHDTAPAAPGAPHDTAPAAPGAPHDATSADADTPHDTAPAAPGAPHHTAPAAPGAPHHTAPAAPGAPHHTAPAAPGAPHDTAPATPGAPHDTAPADPAARPRAVHAPAPAARFAPRDRTPVAALRRTAIGVLVFALVVTGIAVTWVERTGSGPAKGASPSRLVSAQSNRYEYWRVAIREFGDAPLRGGGSGSFRTVWLRERSIDETVRDAHSLYFETAAELGLVGLVALLAFVAGIVVMARRSTGAAGAIGALAVFAIHAGLDWDWELPALALVALTLAARLATPDARPDAS
jgi:hypothetical protein